MNIQSLHLVADINGDGSYSLWEIWEIVRFIYRLPGNLLVEGLGHLPYVSTLLGIHASPAAGYSSLGGMLSVTLSLLFWVAILFTVLNLTSPTVQDPEESAPRTPEADPATLGHHGPDSGTHTGRPHLPVSRPTYAASGIRQHKRHRLSGFLARHAR